jgi:hypothetical protein
MTGLYAVERDIVPAEAGRLARCLQARLAPGGGEADPAPLQQVRAPDGSWFLFRRRAAETSVWEIRLTRVGTGRTEIEIDAAPLAFGPERAHDRLAAFVHDCAEAGTARKKRR